MLIAEDEMLVRIGLKTAIPWEQHNMVVVGEAANGQSAYELYRREQPDLVLTDIKMPLMDGIELIRKIREADQRTRILILTCLEEFALAQEAIQLGVSGYILKLTMSMEEIGVTLAQLRRQLDEYAPMPGAEASPRDSRQEWQKVLASHLFYQQRDERDFYDLINAGSQQVNPGQHTVVLLKVNRYRYLQLLYQDEQGLLVEFALQNVMEEILSHHGSGVFVHQSASHYLLFVNGESGAARNVVQELNRVFQNYFDVTCTGIGQYRANGYPSLADAFERCQALMGYHYFLEDKAYYDGAALDARQIAARCQEALDELRAELAGAYPRGAFAAFEALNAPLEAKAVKRYLFTLWNQLLLQSSLPADNYSHWIAAYTADSEDVDTLPEDMALFRDFRGRLENAAGLRQRYSREVVSAMDLIHAGYSSPLTLDEIAGTAGLSPNYFSNLFKKETGLTPFEYLNRYRIRQAMDLLHQTDMKFYEIAYRVGFASESYFSRTFKKICGCSPNEYQRQPLAANRVEMPC